MDVTHVTLADDTTVASWVRARCVWIVCTPRVEAGLGELLARSAPDHELPEHGSAWG